MQTVSGLLPFSKKLVYRSPDVALDEIQTAIIANGITHVPLIQISHGRSRNIGVVRRKILWQWMVKHPATKATVRDVKEPPLPEVKPDESLASAMKKLNLSSGLLVREEQKLTKFISPKVIALAFQDYAEKFRRIELLEELIRSKIATIPYSEVSEALEREGGYTGKPAEYGGEVERLTFANYQEIFAKCWDSLELGDFSRKQVLSLMGAAREYRNAVFHFRQMEESTGLSAVSKLIRLL